MLVVIIQLFLFVCLLCIYFRTSKEVTVSKFTEISIAILSIGILALSDTTKLFVGAGALAIIYTLKYFHQKKIKKNGTKHNWELDS